MVYGIFTLFLLSDISRDFPRAFSELPNKSFAVIWSINTERSPVLYSNERRLLPSVIFTLSISSYSGVVTVSHIISSRPPSFAKSLFLIMGLTALNLFVFFNFSIMSSSRRYFHLKA